MSKYIFATAIFLLAFSVFSMMIGHQGFSVKILTASFWVILSGCLAYLFESHINA